MSTFYIFRAALGASPNRKLIDETFEYIMTKARDQDVIYYYGGLGNNSKARRLAAEFFKENYDAVRQHQVESTTNSDVIHLALRKI